MIDTSDAAMRLARAIAGDIALYNEDKIVRGIEHDQLFDLLEEELAEGRALYQSRVSPELLARSNYFERAIVDELLKKKGHVRSRIW